ncbi:MAG: oligosaccharide flippase family protein [Proteobacteria bacterium]|nr:oligosaccharide flippase family protein [Pseudomonadota bacterium]
MPGVHKIAAVIAGHLKGRIARGAVDTFALRLFNAGMRFLISLALARMLGAAGFGAYSFAMACVGVLSVPALLGLDGLIVREVASYHAGTRWGLLNGLLRRANQMTLLASTGLALAAAGVAWSLSPYLEPPMLTALWVGLIALPVLTQIRIKQAALLGLRHTVAGQVPEILVQPVLFLLMLGVIVATPGMVPKAPVIVGLFVAAAAGALVVAARLFQDLWPDAVREAEPEYSTPDWIGSARTFFLTAGMNVLGASLGVLMLGPMEGAEATGVYGIATAAATLIALPLTAINIPMAPAVAGFFTEGNKEELQRIATKAARGALGTDPIDLALRTGQYCGWMLLSPDSSYRYLPGGTKGEHGKRAQHAEVFDSGLYLDPLEPYLRPHIEYLPLANEPGATTPLWTLIVRWFYRHIERGPSILGLGDSPYEAFVLICVLGGFYSLLTRERATWAVVGAVVAVQIIPSAFLAGVGPRYGVPTQLAMKLFASVLLAHLAQSVWVASKHVVARFLYLLRHIGLAPESKSQAIELLGAKPPN